MSEEKYQKPIFHLLYKWRKILASIRFKGNNGGFACLSIEDQNELLTDIEKCLYLDKLKFKNIQTMHTQKQPYTWANVKEIVNAMNENQLSEVVRWWGEERGGCINFVRLLDEDYICGDEGFDPVSTYEPVDLAEVMESNPTILKKGTPIIDVD